MTLPIDFDFKEILAKISPSTEESLALKKTASYIISQIKQSAKKLAIDVEILQGGSTAKNTFLKGNFDVDIFVRYKQTDLDFSNTLEKILLPIAKENEITIERVHGSRDYFTFLYNDITFEIVPTKYITEISQVENVTDMSPLHVAWAKKHLTSKLCADIRLAKQFCKAQRVYGAESYINGISGHVLDILVIYYGGFIPLLQASLSWKKPTCIDPNNAHINPFKTLNTSKLQSPLIIIDPVDTNRNAAAALSDDKFYTFITVANEFLSHPSSSFFELDVFDKQHLILPKHTNAHIIYVQPKEGKPDIMLTKVLKLFEHLSMQLKQEGFTIVKQDFYPDTMRSIFYFIIPDTPLSDEYIRQGPPLSATADVERFKEIHASNAFEKDNRVFATVKRNFTDSLDCLNHFLNLPFAKERMQTYKIESIQSNFN